MDAQGRRKAISPVFWIRWSILATSILMSGCVGPLAIRNSRLKYNEAIRTTNDEQLLINVVRLRYADSPIFIDLPSITSQFEMGGVGGYTGGYGNQYKGPTSLGLGQLTLRDTPTLSYHPRQGREIAKALLNPLSADFFSVVNAGARLDQLLWLTLNDINDVQNAPHATSLAPHEPDDNSRFLRGVQLLAQIDDRGGAEMGFTTTETDDETSDAIPATTVDGRDLVGAAKEGYVFRAKDGDQFVLRKREKELTLKIRYPFTHSQEMRELAQIFHLTPGLTRYKIKSELQPDSVGGTPGPEASRHLPSALPDDGKVHDTIYLNLRSILQIMTFLSKGVCVPVQHIADGTAPSTPGPDGQPYDWTKVTSGNFFVASQKHRPKDAEVAVPYRGYWFFIPRQDSSSRSVLAVLEILFSLQESDDKAQGPVLTLPAGG